MQELAKHKTFNPEWCIEYHDYEPDKEKSRESLLAIGNGYLGIRGAMEESDPSDNHYPGTYIAGLYNRLISKVADRDIENEDFVNCPNPMSITFRIDQGPWFDPDQVEVLEIYRALDCKSGLLYRRMHVKDGEGRETLIESERFASMADPHVMGLNYRVNPLNYGGQIEFLEKLDGRLINDGVARYRSLNQLHVLPINAGFDEKMRWLEVESVQSKICIALASTSSLKIDGQSDTHNPIHEKSAGLLTTRFGCSVAQGQSASVTKLSCLYTSKSDDVSDPLNEARNKITQVESYDNEFNRSVSVWKSIWSRIDIQIQGDQLSQRLIRLHLYHLMVTASIHNEHIDAGIPARGLHGEAYRGHIFWDELYILPVYNVFMPEVTKSVLKYRYRRLEAARNYAKEHDYQGAMFPWQSGSDGREETQVLHLNPLSGEWGDDYSSLQRHISIAIAYNVWYYYQVTEDLEFLKHYGAELFLAICRFWASKCEFDPDSNRVVIKKVMGPDEFHEEHEKSPGGGLKDNAYTNIMVAWLFKIALKLYADLPDGYVKQLNQIGQFSSQEIASWGELGQKLNLVISKDGILSQFDGYFDLHELDWDAYRAKYNNIYRLDRILKAEGKSPDDYKLAKQADTLMTFYNLDQEEVAAILSDMGYSVDETLLRKNYQYYIERTSHGSTLSRVVHAYLANQMGEPSMAWELYYEALQSDFNDIQGGTTAEGIHAGVMGGTVLMAITAFSGVNLKKEVLSVKPLLPEAWESISFQLRFKKVQYTFTLSHHQVTVTPQSDDIEQVTIEINDKKLVLRANKEHQIQYQ